MWAGSPDRSDPRPRRPEGGSGPAGEGSGRRGLCERAQEADVLLGRPQLSPLDLVQQGPCEPYDVLCCDPRIALHSHSLRMLPWVQCARNGAIGP